MIDEYTGKKIVSPLDLPNKEEDEIREIKNCLSGISSTLDRISKNNARMIKILEHLIGAESL